MAENESEHIYPSRKSHSRYIAKGTAKRAYLVVEGESATNSKVLKQIEDVRTHAYDFATVDWMARQLSNTY